MAAGPQPAKGPGVAKSVVLELCTIRHTHLLDITALINRAVADSSVFEGVCHIFVPHTTAGVVINESADPDVARDIETMLDRLVPHQANYKHAEGNSDAHVKSALMGVSLSIPIEDGVVALGRWQGIFFCEFDGPRPRKVRLRIVPDPA
jgi:secondary thiamine-phosphate synthase enzyme